MQSSSPQPHSETNQSNYNSNHRPRNPFSSKSTLSHLSLDNPTTNHILLPTAIITIQSSDGIRGVFRALIDQGSQCSFITESAVQLLGVKKLPVSITVSGIGRAEAPSLRNMVSFQINSRHLENVTIDVTALVLRTITSPMPSQHISIPKEFINGIILADPTYGDPGIIDVLLGADVYAGILLDGFKRISPDGPIAQNTILGWIISGPINSNAFSNVNCFHTTSELNETLKRFWELEEIQPKKVVDPQNSECEQFYQNTHRHLENGRYEVQLPFTTRVENCTSTILFGRSRDQAISRLLQMERRLERSPDLRNQYSECIEEYVELGHMIEDTFSENDHAVTTMILNINVLIFHIMLLSNKAAPLRS